MQHVRSCAIWEGRSGADLIVTFHIVLFISGDKKSLISFGGVCWTLSPYPFPSPIAFLESENCIAVYGEVQPIVRVFRPIRPIQDGNLTSSLIWAEVVGRGWMKGGDPFFRFFNLLPHEHSINIGQLPIQSSLEGHNCGLTDWGIF